MKKITIAAVAVLALAAIAPAQNSGSISSGPWMMRKSTGDKTVDRVWFIMDRTLNAADADTMRSMFRGMPGYTSYTMQKAIVNAIDENSKDSSKASGMTDVEIYMALEHGLDWKEKGVLHSWLNTATPSQMTAVAKLVRDGGWANSQWASSGMG